MVGIHRSTVSLALSDDSPSRYAKTLKDIIEALTDFQIATKKTTVHRVERRK